MKILIVAATEQELSLLKRNNFTNVHFLVTGIGIASTIINLMEELSKNNYDFILNVGIAGSFLDSLKIGAIVHVLKDSFGDLGFENGNSFIPLSLFNSSEKKEITFENIDYFSKINHAQTVSAITVNCTSGSIQTIESRKKIFKADIESMEGAAFFSVCSRKTVPYAQIRSISNFIEKRNPENWNIKLALEQLNIEVIDILNYLQNSILK